MMKNLLLLVSTILIISSCEEECLECSTSPEFDNQQFSVYENAPDGTIVDTIQAPDSVTFEILSGNIENAFQINENTGVIRVNNSNALDYESYEIFQLAIRITDNTSLLSNSAVIEISLINIEIPNEGMVGRYSLNGDIIDLSSYKNDGVSNNIEFVNTELHSASNMAAYYSGESSFIKLPTDFDFQSRTISVWFYPTEIYPGKRIYNSDHKDLEYGSTNIDVYYDETTGENYLRMECGGGQGEDLLIEIEENMWWHAVISVDADSVRAYLNGNLYGKTNVSYHHSVDGNAHAYLGCNRNEDVYFFKGLIDNLVVYNRTLSDEEIKILYME